LKPLFRRVTDDRLSTEELIGQMNQALQVPGLANGWTMPIKGRIEMLSTGLRTPVGLKITGADLGVIEQLGSQVETALRAVPGTRSVFAEKTGTGFFLDVAWDRNALARHGISVEEAQALVENGLGGENVTTVISGQERYPVNVRYARDFRSDRAALEHLPVSRGNGQAPVALAQVARIEPKTGPAMIRNEDGQLTGYVFVDVLGRDLDSYLVDAGKALRDAIRLPPGYALLWSGQYESLNRMKQRLWLIIPLTLFLIFLLLYVNTRSLAKILIVLLAVPFSAVGAIWFLYLLDFNLSIGVWVGLIALLGVDAETGIFMLTYLDLAYEQARRAGRLQTLGDLQSAIRYGAVQRLRPKFMTVTATFVGLVPILWSTGTGSDVMKRIAAPMIGGIVTSFILELLVYPGLYQVWKWQGEMRRGQRTMPGASGVEGPKGNGKLASSPEKSRRTQLIEPAFRE
jgi:Cu(I)/Ag(I) efflux system membrane protein CusA/SilA